jgi:hypothetical protein
MANPDAIGAAFAALAHVPADVAELRAKLDEVLATQRAILAALPPQVADVRRVCELTGLSRASVNRRLADGTYRRAAGSAGRRVLVDLSSLRGPDDTEIAKMAAEARAKR